MVLCANNATQRHRLFAIYLIVAFCNYGSFFCKSQTYQVSRLRALSHAHTPDKLFLTPQAQSGEEKKKKKTYPVFDLLVIGDHGSEHGKKLMCIKDTGSSGMKAAIVTVRVRG